MKPKIFFLLLLISCSKLRGQQVQQDSIQVFASDLRKLISINNVKGGIDLSGPEAINLSKHTTAEQIIKITEPYLSSPLRSVKLICFSLLSEAIFKKAKNLDQTQELVEILCKHYLDSDTGIQIVDNVLIQLSEKDFTANSKKYVANLIVPELKSSISICSKLLAVAQVKESIPFLWNYVKNEAEEMNSIDIEVLASLARMGEKKAGELLCSYYNRHINRTDYRYLLISRNIAFSLDASVLFCMIADFKNLDLTKSFRDFDVSFYPAGYLAENIIAMLENYPYSKNYATQPKQLLVWLNENPLPEIKKK